MIASCDLCKQDAEPFSVQAPLDTRGTELMKQHLLVKHNIVSTLFGNGKYWSFDVSET